MPLVTYNSTRCPPGFPDADGQWLFVCVCVCVCVCVSVCGGGRGGGRGEVGVREGRLYCLLMLSKWWVKNSADDILIYSYFTQK